MNGSARLTLLAGEATASHRNADGWTVALPAISYASGLEVK